MGVSTTVGGGMEAKGALMLLTVGAKVTTPGGGTDANPLEDDNEDETGMGGSGGC